MTQRDFYALAVPRFLEDNLPDYWTEYFAGRMTHFEAMKAIFGHIRASEAEVRGMIRDMEPDPRFKEATRTLRGAGWKVEIVSAGCRWYIDQILEQAGVSIPVHASHGAYYPERGLVMELPAESPYCSRQTGIDKAAVVRDALGRYSRVAFAGDGKPDLEAALLVKPDVRFARGWLAEELDKQGAAYKGFDWWSEIVRELGARCSW